MEILLGQKVRDKSSGLIGIVEQKICRLYSSDRVGIQPQCKNGDKMLDAWVVDAVGVEIVKGGEIPIIDVIEPEVIIKLGSKVVDTVTKFEGIVTARSVWLNGCVRLQVTGPYDKKAIIKDPPQVWHDEPSLKDLSDKPKRKDPKPNPARQSTGGPSERMVRH